MNIRILFPLIFLLTIVACSSDDQIEMIESKPVIISVLSPNSGPFKEGESLPVNIEIEIKSKLKACILEILDLTGRAFYQHSIRDVKENEMNIDYSIGHELEAGVYFFKVSVITSGEEFTNATKILII